MSRIANSPVMIPTGVEVSIAGSSVKVKGSKGGLTLDLHEIVLAEKKDDQINFSARNTDKSSIALSGTMRALVNNMVIGVSVGFERKLTLVGVGYRAKLKGSKIELTLGFSHPVVYDIPEGITAEIPSQTEIILKGIDKQKVSQSAANIRAYRPPEPYKGKGVRYADEQISLKEAKKK